MSSYSEHSGNVARILQQQGQARAEAVRQSGQVWGQTIATLGQVIPQQVREAMERGAEKRKAQQMQEILRQANGDLTIAIPQIAQIDPEAAAKLGEVTARSRKAVFDYEVAEWNHKQNQIAFAKKTLADANNQEEYAEGLMTVRAVGVDVSSYPPPSQWSPAVKQRFLTAMLSAEQQLAQMKPKEPTGSWQDSVDAQGKPIKTYAENTIGNTLPQAEATTPEMSEYQRESLRLREAELNKPPAAQAPRSAAGADAPDSGIPPNYGLLLNRATLSIPAVRRPAIVATARMAYEQGGEDALKDVIKQAAVETENVATRNQVTGRANALAALRDIRTTLKNLKASGVDTNILRGSAEDVARKLGTSTNPQLVQAGTRIMDAMIEYRRSLTGVQFGEREAADYQKLFPNYSNTLPVNEAILSGLEQGMATRDIAFWTQKFGQQGGELLGVLNVSPDRTDGESQGGGMGLTYQDYMRRRGAK